MEGLLSTGPTPSIFSSSLSDKVVELVGGGSVISGAYPV